MERPTLEAQIRVSKMTEKELRNFLTPASRLEFWIYCHCERLWHVIYIKLKRKLFGGNRKY